jgi:hypothetical protein
MSANIFKYFKIKYQFLPNKKGPPDLQYLATSRFQNCMQDAVGRCAPYPYS